MGQHGSVLLVAYFKFSGPLGSLSTIPHVLSCHYVFAFPAVFGPTLLLSLISGEEGRDFPVVHKQPDLEAGIRHRHVHAFYRIGTIYRLLQTWVVLRPLDIKQAPALINLGIQLLEVDGFVDKRVRHTMLCGQLHIKRGIVGYLGQLYQSVHIIRLGTFSFTEDHDHSFDLLRTNFSLEALPASMTTGHGSTRPVPGLARVRVG